MCQALSPSGGSSDSRSNQRSSGDGQQGQGEPGSSPLDRQGGTTTQREATPKAPEKGDQGEMADGKDGKKSGEDSQSHSGQPKGNQSSSSAARDAAGSKPGEGERGQGSRADGQVDKWGELPPHVRDIFRAQGGGDLPAQYRDWIDAYYRRLSKRSGS